MTKFYKNPEFDLFYLGHDKNSKRIFKDPEFDLFYLGHDSAFDKNQQKMQNLTNSKTMILK